MSYRSILRLFSTFDQSAWCLAGSGCTGSWRLSLFGTAKLTKGVIVHLLLEEE